MTDRHAQEIPSSNEQACSSHFYSILGPSIFYTASQKGHGRRGAPHLVVALHMSHISEALMDTLKHVFHFFFC